MNDVLYVRNEAFLSSRIKKSQNSHRERIASRIDVDATVYAPDSLRRRRRRNVLPQTTRNTQESEPRALPPPKKARQASHTIHVVRRFSVSKFLKNRTQTTFFCVVVVFRARFDSCSSSRRTYTQSVRCGYPFRQLRVCLPESKRSRSVPFFLSTFTIVLIFFYSSFHSSDEASSKDEEDDDDEDEGVAKNRRRRRPPPPRTSTLLVSLSSFAPTASAIASVVLAASAAAFFFPPRLVLPDVRPIKFRSESIVFWRINFGLPLLLCCCCCCCCCCSVMIVRLYILQRLVCCLLFVCVFFGLFWPFRGSFFCFFDDATQTRLGARGGVCGGREGRKTPLAFSVVVGGAYTSSVEGASLYL